MQAGDTLNFITPFFDGEKKEIPQSNEAFREDADVMVSLMKHFIDDQPDNVHVFDVLEPFGIETVFESSFKLTMQDGSYLHIVMHGTKIENGVTSLGLSVVEHLNDGVYNGGYAYFYDNEGVVRSRSAPDDPEVQNTNPEPGEYDVRKIHFSIADVYTQRDIISEMKYSDNPELQEHALEHEGRIESEYMFDQMLTAEGYENQPPHPGELITLRDLIWDAEPFPLHQVTK